MTTHKEHLRGLNDKQKEAASHKDGPLLIVAGAGAGKTKTITHRIVNLIKEGVAPDKILAVTFTNKAAKEMRERILSTMAENSLPAGSFAGLRPEKERPASMPGRDPVGEEFSAPFVSTFHSLGVHIIKENARALGLTKYFTILDETDSKNLIKETLKELGIDPKEQPPAKIRSIISSEKGKFTSLSEFKEKSQSTFSELVANVWQIYEDKKKKENSLDFDDLLLKSTKLLKENGQVRKFYQEKWDYIHIDEYQDTNEVQYVMSKLLAENNKNICVVGDADQNIYSWRGANLKNILNFEKDYPGTKIIMLEENYRSTKNILEAANEIIKKNKYRPDKNLFTNNEVGEKISVFEALSEVDEAEFVATKVLELVDGSDSREFLSGLAERTREGEPRTLKNSAGVAEGKNTFADIAILYRTNFQSRVLEEAMLRYNIPYQVLGVKFFERREIKDTLAYLRAALNKESLSDIKRIINFPRRGIGKATLAKIFAGKIEDLPIKTRVKINNFYKLLEEIKEEIEKEKVSEVIKFVIKKSGIEQELENGIDEDIDRLQNIKELVTLALKYDNMPNNLGIERLLEDAALASDQDSLMINNEQEENKKEKNGVKLMTVHAAKGLEFKYVFVVGLEDGLFPSKVDEGNKNKEDAEEERRLFYVALTRAKSKLFLSYANFRTIFGSRQINNPSEFLADIPPDLLERENDKNLIKTIYI